MNTESVKTKFEADVTGFTGPVNASIAVMQKMIASLDRMAAAGDRAARRMAKAARRGLGDFTGQAWDNPAAAAGFNPFSRAGWAQHLGGAATNLDVQNEHNRRMRVMSGLQLQQDQEQQKRNRVQSGLATQRVQEEQKQERERQKRIMQEERERQQAMRRAEQQRAQQMRMIKGVGLSAMAGGAAGFMSGNPLSGGMGGLITGAFTGGVPGAIVGGVSGVIGGTIGLGVDLLTKGLGAVLDLTKSIVVETVKLGMEYQRNLAFFQAFTGSKEGARSLMTGLQDIATSSPFKFDQLTGPASLLLGYGIGPDQIQGAVGRLSMASAGDPTRLHRLSLAYAQVMSHGRFMGQELRQFAESGIGAPDFATTMGVSTPEFKRMMTDGMVGPDVVTKTINRLTNPGGRFTDVNTQLLQQVEGRVNQLVETVQIKMGEAGAKLFDKLGIGDKIAGITTAVGPFVEQWLPRIEESLLRIFDLGGRVLQPLIENIKTLIKLGGELWSGPMGKLLLPQSWMDFQMSVLAAGTTVAMFAGGIADLGRAAEVAFAFQMAAITAIADPAGATKWLQSGQQGMAAFSLDPGKYSRELPAPWIKAGLETAAGRKGGWDWMQMGGATNTPNLPPLKTPVAQPAELVRFAQGMKDSMSGGGANAMDKFADSMDKINQAMLPKSNMKEWMRASPKEREGMTMFIPALFNAVEGEQARYQAYKELERSVGGSKDFFKLPEAAMADTTEAVKIALESATPKDMDIQDKIKTVLEKANEQRDKQIEEMKKLNEYLKENPIVVKPKKV